MTMTARLKSLLISHSLFSKTNLQAATKRLGFVQADPIRAPARAQDLILRHRVVDYRAGDLEAAYPSLSLEEDYTFAYGFLCKADHALLHPRKEHTLSALEKKVIRTVQRLGSAHPSDLVKCCGNENVTNAWGGTSKATKCALERAHLYGHLRVARRQSGIRVYEPARRKPKRLPAVARLEQLLLLTLRLFGPTSERFLLSQFRAYRFITSTPADRKSALASLVNQRLCELKSVDGVSYVVPNADPGEHGIPEAKGVKLLAPFDPIVRDRERFEHLWGWAYRFEAYTPASKRVRGYYALPMLWDTDVIGWANAKVTEQRLSVAVGFVNQPAQRRRFRAALKEEVLALSQFLHLEKEPVITEIVAGC